MRDFYSALKLVPACLGLAAVLVCTHASAQTPGFGGSPVTLQRPQLGVAGSGCPVFIRAGQRSLAKQFEAGSTIAVRPAQGVTVTIDGLRAFRITSAEVVVHALSPKHRSVLTGADDLDADVVKPFHLAAKASGEFSGELWMENVTSIRWIEVKSLTYSNGNVWHESENEKCVVRPNPYVLVSSAR